VKCFPAIILDWCLPDQVLDPVVCAVAIEVRCLVSLRPDAGEGFQDDHVSEDSAPGQVDLQVAVSHAVRLEDVAGLDVTDAALRAGFVSRKARRRPPDLVWSL
jgi:hypothetical protein